MTSRFDATTTTTCGYCGVGCRLEAHRVDGRIKSISPAMDGPANKGHTCVKGRFAHQFARSRDRLTAPLVREGDGFRLASCEDWLEVHPEDAAALALREGETVTVRSRRGEIRLPVQITPRIEPGHVFTAFHFPEVRTNLLIGPSADINTSCPEYKVVAVAVEPVGERAGQPMAAGAVPA